MPKVELKDLVTLGNAFCGVAGISLAIAGQAYAWLYVFPAVLLDFLDGRIARKSGANEFGKQLDSLADTVSFVVAPSMVVMLLNGISVWLTSASALYVCTGLWRLARFNLQRDKENYYGLPTPLAALIVLLVNSFANNFAFVAIVFCSIAMVIPVKLKKL